MQETEFSLDLITETAEFIGPCLDKFREEQKIEIIISTLNLLYKSAFVKAHLTTLANERRLKIERFMTEALPHYVAMLTPCALYHGGAAFLVYAGVSLDSASVHHR